MPRPTQTPASNSDARKRNAERERPVPAAGEAATEPHPQFTAFLNELLQDDEVREAYEAAQQGRGAEDIEAATEDVIERAARVLARLGPGEDWPTNEALGGSPTGTRDDEYRAAMLDQARELAAAGLLAGAPGRGEAEIKAEALREAAKDPALRLAGHGGISVTRLLDRAARLAGATDTEGQD